MNNFPKHVAIIMDGNRRWAEKRNLPIFTGHKKGSQTLKKIISECVLCGIEELTVFAFSTENWDRGKFEVTGLFKLIEMYLKSETAEMNLNNILFNPVGNFDCFNKKLNDLLKAAKELTKNNIGLKLNVCLNYGGLQDILYSTKSIARKVKFENLDLEKIDEKLLRSQLLSFFVSNVDLLIRTSGENRISNFLPIQLLYSEMYFTDTLWPDFNKDELLDAFVYFSKRQRRFGSTLSVSNLNNKRD